MPGTKRKASFATPYERPTKLSKRSTSSTVAISKTPSIPRPPLRLPKFPSLKATKAISVKISASAPLPDDNEAPTPPSLRRASTLTLSEEDDGPLGAKKLSTKASKGRPLSLSKKSSSFVEEGALVTRLSGLKSGSIVGETSLTEAATLTKSTSASKSLSKKSSSVRSSASSKGPAIPSGLTKLALTSGGSRSSLRVSKSSLIDNVDETEMSRALASLRSHLSKTGSVELVSDGVALESGEENEKDEMDEEAARTSAEPVGTGAILPPGGLVEIAISFDTTGSMYGCLNEVRAKIQDLVQRLQSDIPGIRIAIIAHGDYCDIDTYIVKWIDFGASLPEICEFVKDVERTEGGDRAECYELVMVRAREALTWTVGSQRVLIMINDDIPHEVGYKYGGNTYHINWRDECVNLRDMGIKIYGVQWRTRGPCTEFNEEMTRITNGKHLRLDNFSNIFDFIMMICYREGNPDMLEVYEKEVRARSYGITADMEALTKTFDTSSSPGGKTSAKVICSRTTKPSKCRPVAKKTKQAKTSVKPDTKVNKTSPKASAKAVKTTKALKKTGKARKKTELKEKRVQKRENVPDAMLNKGPLKNFVWTKWVCAVTPNAPSPKQSSEFTKCKHLAGYRLKSVFKDDTRTPAIYEFGACLQGTRGGKKHVVYMRKTTGWIKKGRWDMYLLRHKSVRQEIDKLVAGGWSIFVRRAVSKGSQKVQVRRIWAANVYIRDNFDYAWKKYIWRKVGGKMSHRQVHVGKKTGGLVISHSNL